MKSSYPLLFTLFVTGVLRMALDFSIELTAENIADRRTKEYFKEVLGCYQAGYLRSSVVMLWTVVVCDLLYKLDQLANASGDTIAKNILEEIEQNRESNPDSPKWEEKLLQLVKDRTELFDAATYLGLSTLQKHRHLSAHPVLTENDALFSPTPETCRAHIRNALEGLLVRPPMMTRKVFASLLEDLEANKRVLVDERSVEAYLSAKYIPFLSSDATKDIFKRLWKLVFRVEDDRCNENREVNYLSLLFLFGKHRQDLTKLIRDESAYFSDCRFDDTPGLALLGFLRRHPDIYRALDNSAQIAIRNFSEQDDERYATAWYLSVSVVAHAEQVFAKSEDSRLGEKTLDKIAAKLREVGDLTPLIKFGIRQYVGSPSYDAADERFELLISPFLSEYRPQDVVELIRGSEENSQTRTRRRAGRDHRMVREHLDTLDIPDFNLSDFPKMESSMKPVAVFPEVEEIKGDDDISF